MKMKKILFCTAAFFMLSSAGIRVSAAETLLPVTQIVTVENDNTLEEDVSVQYTLIAETSGAPMPDGQGEFIFSITGSSTYEIPNIQVTQEGKWHYRLTAESDKAELEKQEIYLTLYSSANAESFSTMMIAELPDGTKCDLTFYLVLPEEELPTEPTDIPISETETDTEPTDIPVTETEAVTTITSATATTTTVTPTTQPSIINTILQAVSPKTSDDFSILLLLVLLGTGGTVAVTRKKK